MDFRDALRYRRARRWRRRDRFLNWRAASPFIFGVVGWVDLQSPQVRSQVETVAANPTLVGVRHVVQGEPDDRFLLRPEFLRGVSILEELIWRTTF
jgi:L-fuconolactonase